MSMLNEAKISKAASVCDEEITKKYIDLETF